MRPNIAVAFLALGSLTACAHVDEHPQTTRSTHSTSAAEPASVNPAPRESTEPDRGTDGGVTPMDQSESASDIAITAQIRRAIIADDTLSIAAKNIIIVTADGVVTLRGSVSSEAEKSVIEQKARAVVGIVRLDNQLDVSVK